MLYGHVSSSSLPIDAASYKLFCRSQYAMWSAVKHKPYRTYKSWFEFRAFPLHLPAFLLFWLLCQIVSTALRYGTDDLPHEQHGSQQKRCHKTNQPLVCSYSRLVNLFRFSNEVQVLLVETSHSVSSRTRDECQWQAANRFGENAQTHPEITKGLENIRHTEPHANGTHHQSRVSHGIHIDTTRHRYWRIARHN